MEVELPKQASKRLINLAKKVMSDGKLSQYHIISLRKVLKNTENLERQEFLSLLRANSEKTDEELIKELEPYLSKAPSAKGGRPRGSNNAQHRDMLMLAYRLRQRGLTHQQIGEQMKVSHTTVEGYLREVRGILRLDPALVDVPQQIGETLHFYDDIRQMALLIASSNTGARAKLAAMQIAMNSEADKTTFMQKVGIFAPEVSQYMQQLVIQQNVIQQGESKEDPMEAFFTTVAGHLMAHKGHTMDAIVQEVEDDGE